MPANADDNEEEYLEEEVTEVFNPEGLMTGSEFLRLAERRDTDEDMHKHHCFVVFVHEADPKDGFRPVHP